MKNSCNIILDENIQKLYGLSEQPENTDELLKSLQPKAKSIHLRCMNLLRQLYDCRQMFFGDKDLDVLKLILNDDSFFPHFFCHSCEVDRIYFGHNGFAKLDKNRKKMLIIGIFIYRLFLGNILTKPEKFIKDYQFSLENRIKIRLVGSIIYCAFAEWIGQNLS